MSDVCCFVCFCTSACQPNEDKNVVWRPCGSMFDIVEDAGFFAGDRGEFSGLRDAAAGWNGMTVERIPALATASKLSRANMSSVLT